MSPVADFTVLVVEDHDFQRRTILQILANLGVGSLLEAADGEAALTLLDAGNRPDIVVCDLDMPGMDGVELIRHVAERHRRIAVVFASGLEERVVAAADRTARAYGVTVLGAVQKPLTARRLLAAIGEYEPPAAETEANGAPGAAPTGEEVLAALARGELATALVPIIAIGTGTLAGVEALVRWPGHAPEAVDLAALAPAPGAEAVGTLSSHLLGEACAAQRTLAAAGYAVPASIAAPLPLLGDVALPDYWAKGAADAGADPRLITILVGEEPVLAEDATALDVLTRLRLKGFAVALASSGSGAIAASRLERGPFGAVRFGAELVAEAVAARRGATGTGALEGALELARGLRLETEAAGCDTREAWDLLARLGCERALGSFIAPPMPPGEVASWAAGWSAERRA